MHGRLEAGHHRPGAYRAEKLDMALFYMDMRTPRKDFEKYMVRIKDQGARLIRSRVHTITPGHDGDL